MPTITMTSRLLRVYADKQSWKQDHDEARSCRDIEEQMAWGIRIFEGLLDLEARTQIHALRRTDATTEQLLAVLPILYQSWADASEFFLGRASELASKGYEVDGLARFRATVEEARCLIDNLNLEEQIPPIEQLMAGALPANPHPERYRD